MFGRSRSAAATGKSKSPADAAFEAFYRQWLTSTTRTIALMTGSIAVAEDLAHSAMQDVYRRWSSLREPETYLLSCAANGALRWLQRASRKGESRRTDDLTTSAAPREFIEMQQVMAKLADRERIVVVLHYYGGLSESEIADILRCTERVVLRALDAARVAIRREPADG